MVRRALPLLLLAALAAGCGGAPDAGVSDAGLPTVVVPGAPGEEASLLPADEARERMAPQPVSPADVGFVTGMIPHHQQALDMAALVPDRGTDPQVRAVAERISAVQGAEILALEGWLDAQAESGLLGGHGGHADGAHPGMATPEQLAELGAADGPAFDRLFLQLMITHHEGALRMADEQQAGGTDLLASQMSADVKLTQGVEIERMRELLGST